MLIQPKGEKRVPAPGRWALGALRLLGGALLLAEMVLAAGHSHQGELTSSSHCAVCQVVALDLDSHADVPGPPSQDEVRETWVLPSLYTQAFPPAIPGLFPRGPPSFA